jgi:hypothetical protein
MLVVCTRVLDAGLSAGSDYQRGTFSDDRDDESEAQNDTVELDA